jgi:peptidyl-prolyl cis-trans isomerase D
MYYQMLQYVLHTQARIFEEQIRQNLMLAKLYKDITTDVSLTDGEIKEEYAKANEEVSIYYISSLPSDFEKDIVPSETDLKDYFNQNAIDFKQPLSFNLEYAATDSEDKLRSVMALLNKKKDLAEIAKGAGLEAKETGIFTQTSPIPGIGWSAEIMSIIAKLKIGEISMPINLDKQYYIFKLKERKEPHIPEFETVKDQSRTLAQEKIKECLKKLTTQYQADPKSVDFDKTAQESGLKYGSTEPFKYGSYLEGIGTSDNFWAIGRSLKEDEFSQIMEMLSGFYIIKTKSKVAADEKKFAEEKDKFTQALLEQKKQEVFVKFVEELKKKTKLF